MVISVILITDKHDVSLGFEMAGNMEILGVTNYPARLPALQMAGNMGILCDTKNNAISVKVTIQCNSCNHQPYFFHLLL